MAKYEYGLLWIFGNQKGTAKKNADAAVKKDKKKNPNGPKLIKRKWWNGDIRVYARLPKK